MSLGLRNITNTVIRRSDMMLWSIHETARHGLPGVFVHVPECGLGDILLCSILFRELRKRGARNIWVMSPHPELFENNPDVDRIVCHNDRYVRLAAKMQRCIVPYYATYQPETDIDLPPHQHIIAEMCRRAKITGSVNLKPHIWLTEDEKLSKIGPDLPIVIHSSGGSAQYYMRNKDWYPERFQQVVDALSPDYRIVQIGSRDDPPLNGVLDLRGKTSLRETAAVLHGARLFVGQVGFPMHLARAVDCRSVIVYGGREPAEQTGYIANENISRQPMCSPCWYRNRCEFDRACMNQITSDEVVAACLRQLEHFGEPLAVEEYEVQPKPGVIAVD